MNRAVRKRLLRWTLVLAWMGVIFFLSAMSAEESAALSEPFAGVTGSLYAFLRRIFPELQFAAWVSIVAFTRKAAHFFCYFALSSCAYFALAAHKSSRLFCALLSFGISVVYAVSDEIHQSFVPGRAMRATDVLIDALGAICGIGLCVLIVMLRARRKRKP